MKRNYGIPDFNKLYPEASESVIIVLRQTERKMKYQEYELKKEKFLVNQKENKVTCIPSREDSYERLLDMEYQFIKEQPSVEEEAIRAIMYEKLYKALRMLKKEDRDLLIKFYFQERSEREIANQLGLSQNAINKRRHKILKRLYQIMEKL